MTYRNSEVIDEFVRYGLDENIKAKHLFFIKDVLFSYGSHYPLCIRLKNGFLINGSGYSMTTSTHTNELIRQITGNSVYNLKQLKREIEMGEIDDIKVLSTQEMQKFIDENTQQNLSFISVDDIDKIKILKAIREKPLLVA